LGLIPKKTPLIAYIETFKTDFDRLIYNCGGIFRLWFGLTPVKAVDLIQYSTQISITSRDKIKRIVQNLFAIIKRCINFIINILLRFGDNLFVNLLLMSHKLITFCIRCFRKSFSHFINFVYKIFAIFKQCFVCINVVIFRFIRNLSTNL
jgi:hypothetical protein